MTPDTVIDTLHRRLPNIFKFFFCLTIFLSFGALSWVGWSAKYLWVDYTTYAATYDRDLKQSSPSTLAPLRLIACVHFVIIIGFMIYFIVKDARYCKSRKLKELHDLGGEDKDEPAITFTQAFRFDPKKETLSILLPILPLVFSATYSWLLAAKSMPELQRCHDFLLQHTTDTAIVRVNELVSGEQVFDELKGAIGADLAVEIVFMAFVLLIEIAAICRLFHLRHERECREYDLKFVAAPQDVRVQQTGPPTIAMPSFEDIQLSRG